jgi:penicillin-binding protein 1C
MTPPPAEPRRPRRWPVVALLLVVGAGASVDALTLPPPLPDPGRVRAQWRPSEAWLYDRQGRLLDSLRIDFAARRAAWVPIGAVSPALRESLVAAEDRRFFAHGGVDWIALGGTVRDRLAGRRPRGASTLTMQLAGFLAPDLARPGARGWLDKLRQMRAARAIESGWSKAQILEAYLNLAPFRGEAQGVGAASAALLGQPPASIGRRDALLLTALLPDPAAAPAKVAARACRLGRIADCRAMTLAAATMLSPARSRSLDPDRAPHLAMRLLTAPGMRVRTTIDAAVQDVAARALRRQLQGLGPRRVRDGAVVVVDNASGDVLAYVGGVGLGSTAAQVDGADAYRQAGSTLKPFLYAQLIERKWLTAASILDDSPVQLDTASGLYVPRNYDRAFAGPVSARHALAASLNVPAVRALLLGGVQPFRDRLWDLGYRGLSGDGDFYGFSLALGSADVTLLEQANAYRTLANGGRFAPLRLVASDPRPVPRPLVAPGAAWIVGDILADAAARASTFGVDSALRLPFWAAAKTGTSKGMRDNWCIGFSSRYTVAVWVGNLEGDPMRAVSGTSGAAPVWRDIMLALHRDRPPRPPARAGDVIAQPVRFAGGIEAPRREWFLRGTGQAVQAVAPAAARRPRIVNPVSGSVYALDPDIPPGRQSLGIGLSGAIAGHRLRLDDADLGDAVGAPQLPLRPGGHRLALLAPDGRAVDQVRFTVR